jgi:signal transduction histidine kinase
MDGSASAAGDMQAHASGSAKGAPTRRRSPKKRDFSFTLARDWRIASITKDAAAWCGFAPGDLVGRDAREALPSMTKPIAEAATAAFVDGATTTLEHASLHATGRWVKLEIGPWRKGIRFRFEDITSTVARDPTRGNLGAGSAEIVLLDSCGVIVAANGAWRASFAEFGLDIADAGVGASYVEVCKAAVPTLNATRLRNRLDDLFHGRTPSYESDYNLDRPHGRESRHVQIAPLRIGEAAFFAAIHEDQTQQARTLATLNETADRLLHAQEEERQRIAIELHDSMSQHLAGLVLTIAQLRRRTDADPVTRALTDQMAELTQQAIRETRVLSFLLNASGRRDQEGLGVAVRRFVDGFGRRTGLEATLKTEGSVDGARAAVQHAIFRVIQESLSNVYQHAHATQVSVRLTGRGGVLTVQVADNGRGICPDADKGAPPLGVGIPGMRARIEQLGGELRIAGGAGGTVVTASVPLRAQLTRTASRAGAA